MPRGSTANTRTPTQSVTELPLRNGSFIRLRAPLLPRVEQSTNRRFGCDLQKAFFCDPLPDNVLGIEIVLRGCRDGLRRGQAKPLPKHATLYHPPENSWPFSAE